MQLDLIVTALLPVFFVLVLGYGAGRYHRFDADQAAGLNQLVTNFALPASLFVGTVQIKRDLLLQQGPLLLVILAVHLGLFGVLWRALRGRFGLSPVAVILLALGLSTSSASVYGPAVLSPVAGAASGGAIGLVTLVTNIVVPLALFMLQRAAAAKGTPSSAGANPGKGTQQNAGGSVTAALIAALTSPLLLAPVTAMVLVLLSVHIAAPVLDSLRLLGQVTTGLGVFAIGLTLAAHKISLSKLVLLSALVRVTLQSALLLGLLVLFDIRSDLDRATVLACSLPVGVLQALLASRYGEFEQEMASILLVTTLAMIGALPAWYALTGWLLPA